MMPVADIRRMLKRAAQEGREVLVEEGGHGRVLRVRVVHAGKRSAIVVGKTRRGKRAAATVAYDELARVTIVEGT